MTNVSERCCAIAPLTHKTQLIAQVGSRSRKSQLTLNKSCKIKLRILFCLVEFSLQDI